MQLQGMIDQFYIRQSIYLLILMLTTILRLGPFNILEIILVAAAASLWLLQQLPSCYYYTLIYLALLTFLIEMILSLKLIKTHPALRKLYVTNRVTQTQAKFYSRMVWDNLNVLIVVMLIYSCLVADGIMLTSIQDKVETRSNANQKQPCQFTLFSLCLFAQLQGGQNMESQDSMIMWVLYSVTTFLSSVIVVAFSKQYYQYCSNLTQNRRLLSSLAGMNETLLDCSIYKIGYDQVVNRSLSEELGECSICLGSLICKGGLSEDCKVIKLSCSHLFHQQCIQKWLKVKDHCPFRCCLRHC